MTFGLFPEATVTGVSTATREIDGIPMDVDVLELTSTRGAGARKSPVRPVSFRRSRPPSSPNRPAEIGDAERHVETKTMDSLKPAIAFEAGSGRVESLEDMCPARAGTGIEAAPTSSSAARWARGSLSGFEARSWCLTSGRHGAVPGGLPLVRLPTGPRQITPMTSSSIPERQGAAASRRSTRWWRRSGPRTSSMPTLIVFEKITQDCSVARFRHRDDRSGRQGCQAHRGYSPGSSIN